jgi:hypothetical protein
LAQQELSPFLKHFAFGNAVCNEWQIATFRYLAPWPKMSAICLADGAVMISQTTRLPEVRQALTTQFNAIGKFLVLCMDVRN